MVVETPMVFSEKIAQTLGVKLDVVDDLFDVEEDKTGYFVAKLKPKQFLDKMQFRGLCSLARDLGGEGYIEGAKAWKVPGPLAKMSQGSTLPAEIKVNEESSGQTSSTSPSESIPNEHEPDSDSIPSPMVSSEDMAIADIVVDTDFMMREAIDKKTIELYKENLVAIIQASPIVVFETPNGLMLVDGFHRLAAARQLNWEQINVQKYKGSVQDAFAFACLANLKHGRPLSTLEKKHAVCEYVKLNVKLSNVQISLDVGLSDEAVRRYRQELEDKGDIEPQETRLGVDGKERILPTSTVVEVDPFDAWFKSHVTCADLFNVLPNDPLQYDLIILDPPYGITDEKWDTKFDLLNETRRWLNLVLQKLKSTGRMFVFWSREYFFELKPLFDEIKNEYPLNFGGLIVWNFRNTLSIPNNRKELKITWEPIFHFYRDDAPELNRPDTELTGKKWTNETDSDVWAFAVPQTNFKQDPKIHPAQKPLDLYKHIIQLTTKPNELILDPFAGSGTTGHAAYQLGREFHLIEQSSDYVAKMRERLKGVFNNGNNK